MNFLFELIFFFFFFFFGLNLVYLPFGYRENEGARLNWNTCCSLFYVVIFVS